LPRDPGAERRVVLFADDPDWHSRRLGAACTRRGATVVVESLRRCRFELGAKGPGVTIPALEGGLPDVAIVRSIPNGSFEQVTFRLSLLHALRELGVPVMNDARAIERCVDKSMTSFLLHRAGIPTPATLVTEDGAPAAPWREGQKVDIVAKPLFGAQGRGLRRIAPDAALPDPEELSGVLYLQRYVGRQSAWRDFRVFVVGDAAVAAMMRTGASWITNVARGGICERVPCEGRLAALAVAASRAVGVDYSGVDLIEDAEGALAVLEVNSMPAWKGLQGVADMDIADAIARHALARP
jgi:tetrahydromethanopterin:alpha-L-glutamate ligase